MRVSDLDNIETVSDASTELVLGCSLKQICSNIVVKDEETLAIMTGILQRQDCQLETLQCVDCTALDPQLLVPFLGALSVNQTIKSIGMSFSETLGSEESQSLLASSFAQMIAENTALQKLLVSGLRLHNPQVVGAFTDALLANQSIHALSIQSTGLSETGLREIAACLSDENTTIRSFRLKPPYGRNTYSIQAVFEAFTEAMERNPAIVLYYNGPSIAEGYEKLIHITNLNASGRQYLTMHSTTKSWPISLWPKILERAEKAHLIGSVDSDTCIMPRFEAADRVRYFLTHAIVVDQIFERNEQGSQDALHSWC